jgi:deazaflavin-dependent oxidoreductase (nitroreductase family)
MSEKQTQNSALKERLARASEIEIGVTGRKSGKTISVPVWFVWEGGKLYLLPVKGSDTQWYKNVVEKPTIRVGKGAAEAEIKVDAVSDAKQVSSVVEKFRAKYGDSGMKYYSKLDVAVLAQVQ